MFAIISITAYITNLATKVESFYPDKIDEHQKAVIEKMDYEYQKLFKKMTESLDEKIRNNLNIIKFSEVKSRSESNEESISVNEKENKKVLGMITDEINLFNEELEKKIFSVLEMAEENSLEIDKFQRLIDSLIMDIEKERNNSNRATDLDNKYDEIIPGNENTQSDNSTNLKSTIEDNLEKKINPERSKFKLEINAHPSDSRIRILNIKQKYHEGIMLSPGKYKIEISHSGYEKKIQTISLDKDKSIRIGLSRKRYPMKIRITPSSASIVFKKSGKPFYNGMSLLPGNYRLSIHKNGYAKREITVKHGESPSDVTIRLVREKYKLILNTVPSKPDTIRLINKRTGRTIKYYWGMMLPTGEYGIKVSHRGYRPKSMDFKISGRTKIVTLKLKKR